MDCIIDSGTTHTILRDRRLFESINTAQTTEIRTIGNSVSIIEGHGPARLRLPRGTVLQIQHAIYAPNATRNLLSLNDILLTDLEFRQATTTLPCTAPMTQVTHRSKPSNDLLHSTKHLLLEFTAKLPNNDQHPYLPLHHFQQHYQHGTPD